MISGFGAICFRQLRLQHAGGGKAKEDVSSADDIGENARIGLLHVDRFPAVHQRIAAFIDDAIDIADPDVLAVSAELHQQVQAGEGRCAGAGSDDLDLGELFAGKFHAVEDSRRHDDRRAMLVVMEDRDVHFGAKLFLDFETFRRLDVFEIDAAESRLECRYHIDDLVDFLGVDFDIEHIDIGEFLEQDGFAFHHGLGRERADIAEAENRSAVGDDCDEIGAARIVGCRCRILVNGQTWRGDAGRIGKGEVALISQRLRRLDFQLTRLRKAMIEQRAFFKVRAAGSFGRWPWTMSSGNLARAFIHSRFKFSSTL